MIEVHFTAGSIDEARKIARHLVESRLVACAQIIPWIESIYIWNNKLETTQESKVTCKTKQEHFEKVKKAIIERSSYEVPEIISLPIQEMSEAYQTWFESSF